MFYRFYYFIILFVACITNMHAQTLYCDKIDNEIIIDKTYLTISYDTINKIPNYVGYYITKNTIKGNINRNSISFYTERDIPYKYRTYPNNYLSTGYDRGHMSPAADWKFNKNAMRESFSMANISPQTPSLNRIYWKSVEDLERIYANQCDTLYIISGTIVNSTKKYIKNNIVIPNKFFKTMVGIKNNKVSFSCAWIFNNDNSKQPQEQHKTTIKYIENIICKKLYFNFYFKKYLLQK